jgi:hypothetical protein
VHLTGIDYFLWAVAFILHLALLFTLFYRGRAKAFPFFTSLVTLNVARTVVLYLIFNYGSKQTYFNTFWSLGLLDVILQLGVVYEVASRVFRPLNVWAPDVRSSFLWLLNISTTVALGLAWAENPAAQNSVQAFVARGNLFAAVLESEILVAMVALSANANLPWKTHVAKIARGLGVYSLVSVMFECAQSYTGTSRMLPTLSTLNHVLISVYLSCVVYWIISLSRNEQPARVMTPEMREKVFALGSQLAYDLQDLQSRKKS